MPIVVVVIFTHNSPFQLSTCTIQYFRRIINIWVLQYFTGIWSTEFLCIVIMVKWFDLWFIYFLRCKRRLWKTQQRGNLQELNNCTCIKDLYLLIIMHKRFINHESSKFFFLKKNIDILQFLTNGLCLVGPWEIDLSENIFLMLM